MTDALNADDIKGPDIKGIAARVWDEALNKGDFSVLEAHVPANSVDHMAEAAGSSARYLVQGIRDAFPDLRYSIDAQYVDGDTVVTRVTGTGTQTGSFQGLPGTGKTTEWTEVHVIRFDGDQMVEHWHVGDTSSRMQQLGLKATPLPELTKTIELNIPADVASLVDGYGD